MNHPFDEIKIGPEIDFESLDEDQKKKVKRDAIYQKFDPMVNEVLDLFISAHRQGAWEKDSDCSRQYCCHVAWFAGPKEKYSDPYDRYHTIRRRLEIRMEMDGFCNPTGFTVTHYDAVDKIIHVGLDKEGLVRGIKAVMA